MKKQVPEQTSEKIDANLRVPTQPEVAKNNDGSVYQSEDEVHPVSKSSNNLSNDISGSTQHVNLDTSEITEDNHELPDGDNTIDRPNPEAETHVENNEPLDKSGEDDYETTDKSEGGAR